MAGDVEVVTFDFWDTLVVAHLEGTRELRRQALLAVLADHGHDDVTGEMLEEIFEDTVRTFNESWAANRQFTATQASAHVMTKLDRELSEQTREALHEGFLAAGAGGEVSLTDGIADTLRLLDEAGLRLGIICDVGMTPSTVLRSYLERFGLLDRFDHWSFSDDVGVYKPDPVIFGHALDGLGGVDPARAVHVGDLRRTDVAGAKAFGMVAVRYRGARDDHSSAGLDVEGDHVLDHHADLPTLLGLG